MIPFLLSGWTAGWGAERVVWIWPNSWRRHHCSSRCQQGGLHRLYRGKTGYYIYKDATFPSYYDFLLLGFSI